MISGVDHRPCPWQHGPRLTNWTRRVLNDPVRITKPYVEPGQTVMDVGCGMGFFTVPMSRMVGASGRVIAVDVQPEMLDGLRKNVAKSGCANVTVHQCGPTSLDIGQWTGAVGFANVFYMFHEAPDQSGMASEIFAALKPGGTVLFAEPVMHVNKPEFEEEAGMFAQAGFAEISRPRIPISHTIVWRKA